MEGVNNEDNPMLQTNSIDSEEDICTSSKSTGANKRKRDDNERKMNKDAIYSFMRFPRSLATEAVSLAQNRQAWISTCDVEFPTLVGSLCTDFLESLVSLTSNIDARNDDTVSIKHMKAALYRNIFLRVAYSAAEARFLDRSSFRLLDKIFKELANIWMNTSEVKTKKEQESQQYQFKPRAIKIDNIVEIDISSLGSILLSEIFSEWQDFLSKEESTDKENVETGDEALEDEWDISQESVLKDIVHIHNFVFGLVDLVRSPGSIEISDADRLYLFEDSYSLGVKMIESLEAASPSSFDATLTLEHLLHRTMDCEKNMIVSWKPTRAYNFYEDSNTPVMAKMVEPLNTLKAGMSSFMTELGEHRAPQKILDVIDMILGIPLSTPLAKALMALQFLLSRVQIMQETVSEFSHSDQLKPILALIVSWKELEFQHWTALLDEVQSRYEINAGKLWFPLYSSLQRTQPANLKTYSDLTSQSLKKFIKTSNIGEFRQRLLLLFAMHGQIKTGITQRYNSRISEHINVRRESIEQELKAFVNVCRGEHSDAYIGDNSKRTRQNLLTIIQKYNDLLQQPLMHVLKEKADPTVMAKQIMQSSSPGLFDQNALLLVDALMHPHFGDKDRFTWTDTWKTKTDAAIETLQVLRTTDSGFSDSSGVLGIMKYVLSSSSLCSRYLEERRKVWCTIRKIYETVVLCGSTWREAHLSTTMRWYLSEILNRLRTSGLSKPTSKFLELAQPSYNVQHLLLRSENNSEKDQASPHHRLETQWRSANKYFFRSISSVRQLQSIRKNLHKDFKPNQASQSLCYLYHLIAIQQEQRAAAYEFAARLETLKKSILPLENLFSSSDPSASDSISFPKNQHATYNCMWQQKQLFDGSCALLHDISLLLRTIQSSDLDPSQKDVTKLLSFVEDSVPQFQKRKDSLDDYLLGKDRILTSVELKLQPNGVTKEMVQFVNQNFCFITEFEERVSALRKQDVGSGSAANILFGRLESIFLKGTNIAGKYDTIIRSRNHPEHMDEDPDRFVSGFFQALEQTYKDILGSFSKFGSSDPPSDSENSLGNICMWTAIFKSNISSLKLEAICDGLAKTIQFAVRHATHLRNLYSLLEQTMTYGQELLLDFVLMHRAVSQISDELAKMFVMLYSQGYPPTIEELVANGTFSVREPEPERIPEVVNFLAAYKNKLNKAASNVGQSKTEEGMEMETDTKEPPKEEKGDVGEDVEMDDSSNKK